MPLFEYFFATIERIGAVVLGFLVFVGAALVPNNTLPNMGVFSTPEQEIVPAAHAFPAALTTKTAETKIPPEEGPPEKSLLPSHAQEKSLPAQTSTDLSASGGAPQTSQESSAPSGADTNAQARASLVNILCTTQAGGYLHPISGSGTLVDSRGIILTNAHLGQYFLLRNYGVPDNVQCVIRIGSPAKTRYTAELLYLPPAWIDANASKILLNEPTGTGENDYAFLRITGTTDPSGTLPQAFPALVMDRVGPDAGERMLLASYPAGFLDGLGIELNLYQTSAITSVGPRYSFGDTAQVDVFSIGGTIVSQAGSSGGAVVNAATGVLEGIITTSSASSTTAGRDLNAITLAHIDRSLKAAGQGGIEGLLMGNTVAKAVEFNKTVAPGLTAKLESFLKKALP